MVVLGTADWGLPEGRELCKHLAYTISCNIHNSHMGVDTIIPSFTAAEGEAQRGKRLVVPVQPGSSHTLPGERV